MLRSELAEKIRRNCNWTIGTRITSDFDTMKIRKKAYFYQFSIILMKNLENVRLLTIWNHSTGRRPSLP